MSNWPREDVAVMLRYYETEGPRGIQKLMPHRSLKSIQMKAIALGLSAMDEKRTTLDFTGLPATNLVEQLECVRLRKWRGPVDVGPLVPSLGRRAA